MNAADASSLSLWSALSLLGFALVIIGVVLEGIEIIARRTTNFRKKPLFGLTEYGTKIIEDAGWFILVVGLALEMWGHIRVTEISDKENARLSKELSAAITLAGDANKQAGDANRLAAESNEKSKQLEAQNLVLRSNVVALELKMQDRRITLEQTTNFMFLAEKIEKIPITIWVFDQVGEIETFARDLRAMFSYAGFTTNASADVTSINRAPGAVRFWEYFLSAHPKSSVMFMRYSSNKTYALGTVASESTNGLRRPINVGKDEKSVYEAIAFCFQQLGISNEWVGTDLVIKPGEYGIAIRTK